MDAAKLVNLSQPATRGSAPALLEAAAPRGRVPSCDRLDRRATPNINESFATNRALDAIPGKAVVGGGFAPRTPRASSRCGRPGSQRAWRDRQARTSILAFRQEGSRLSDPSAMRVLKPFRDVRSRLLALVALIIVPVALVTIALAAANDRSLSKSIDRQWRQSTGDYAVRTRIWATSAVRTLWSSAASANGIRDDENLCATMLHDVVAVNDGYKAIRVDFDDGHFCVGAENRDLATVAGAVSGSLRSRPRVRVVVGHDARGGSVSRPRSQRPRDPGRCARDSPAAMDRDRAHRSPFC